MSQFLTQEAARQRAWGLQRSMALLGDSDALTHDLILSDRKGTTDIQAAIEMKKVDDDREAGWFHLLPRAAVDMV